jgi:hypothetical protein
MIQQARKRRKKAMQKIQQDLSLLEFYKCFFVLLNTVGGVMTVTKEVLNNLPPDWQSRFKIDNLPDLGAYRISIQKDNTIQIITPEKRVIKLN